MEKRNWDDPQYKKWRAAVRARDKGKCQWPYCVHKQKVQCHHIVRWSDNAYLRYVVDNGICLCKFHHDFIKGKEDAYIGLFKQIIANGKVKRPVGRPKKKRPE